MAGTATGMSGSMTPLGTLSGGGGSENELILGGGASDAAGGFFSAEADDAAGGGGCGGGTTLRQCARKAESSRATCELRVRVRSAPMRRDTSANLRADKEHAANVHSWYVWAVQMYPYVPGR